MNWPLAFISIILVFAVVFIGRMTWYQARTGFTMPLLDKISLYVWIFLLLFSVGVYLVGGVLK